MGDKCTYAHGEEELRSKEQLTYGGGAGQMGGGGGMGAPGSVAPYSNYKTRKCKFFMEEGQCKFGSNCTFAHDGEVRGPYDDVSAEEAAAQSFKPPAQFGMGGAMPQPGYYPPPQMAYQPPEIIINNPGEKFVEDAILNI
jgi:hypothetical protein